MKIKRYVNGKDVEFELTCDELMWAYYEHQELVDKEDIKDVLKEMRVWVSDTELELIVDVFRDYLSEDDNWRLHAKNAIKEVLDTKKEFLYGSKI